MNSGRIMKGVSWRVGNVSSITHELSCHQKYYKGRHPTLSVCRVSCVIMCRPLCTSDDLFNPFQAIQIWIRILKSKDRKDRIRSEYPPSPWYFLPRGACICTVLLALMTTSNWEAVHSLESSEWLGRGWTNIVLEGNSITLMINGWLTDWLHF